MADDLEKMLNQTLRKFEEGCSWGASLSDQFDGFADTFSNVARNLERLRKLAKNGNIDTKQHKTLKRMLKTLRAFSREMAEEPVTVSNLIEDHVTLRIFDEEIEECIGKYVKPPKQFGK